ncbi:uncharacterized protein METZ01_LOCUS472437, partial [marine metagenome]
GRHSSRTPRHASRPEGRAKKRRHHRGRFIFCRKGSAKAHRRLHQKYRRPPLPQGRGNYEGL